jgi:hypothetical protein
MSRWPLVTGLCFAPCIFGCATSIQPGLANGPRLGGSQVADERIHDVVSNGGDSCGRYAEQSPLRGRVPPCPTVSPPATASTFAPVTIPSGSLVVPWLDHFYYGWPCPRASSARAARATREARTTGWVATMPSADQCAMR